MSVDATAIVPAAGVGRRFSPDMNKTYVDFFGRPLLISTLEALSEVPEIVEIIPVIKAEDMAFAADLLDEYPVSKVRRIAPGGDERQDSVYHGLKLVEKTGGAVLIHDGVRPLIDPALVSGAIALLEGFDGVILGVPVKDTIKVAEDGVVEATLKRESLWAIQTPQIFMYETIMSAYEKAAAESYYATDDSALVERYGGKVRVVMGSYHNIKITTPEDIILAQAFANMRKCQA